MSLILERKNPASYLGVWKMEETVEEMLSLFLVSAFYRDEIQKFASDKRRKEWLAVRVLLAQMLGEEKHIAYQESGKPYLIDHSFYISISHTKDYVAVILSEKSSVGIDIECFRDKVCHLSHRFVRDDERAFPYNGIDTWSLLLHWSAKEAIYKCIKDADPEFLKIRLSPFEPQSEGVVEAKEFWTPQSRTMLVSYLIHDDFVLTWLID